MTIASRFIKAAKIEHAANPNNVHGFMKDVRFAATDSHNNYEESYTEYLFKDKSVLAQPFICNFSESGNVSSLQLLGLDTLREIDYEGWE
jgi:hypothetical protein